MEEWIVHLIDTGIDTQTGGRIKRVKDLIGDETFMMTYGDSVANIDITKLVRFHKSHGRLATVTAVRPPARFGGLVLKNEQVISFEEKPQIGEGWINGGFFLLEPGIFDYIDGDQTIWEREPMERLTKDGELMAFKLMDFWHCMDTLRDIKFLRSMWEKGDAPWKIW